MRGCSPLSAGAAGLRGAAKHPTSITRCALANFVSWCTSPLARLPEVGEGQTRISDETAMCSPSPTSSVADKASMCVCARAHCECVGACGGLRVMIPQERQTADDSRAVCARPRGTTLKRWKARESARETEGERPTSSGAGRQRSTRGEARRDLGVVTRGRVGTYTCVLTCWNQHPCFP